jgi:hypothetical protein
VSLKEDINVFFIHFIGANVTNDITKINKNSENKFLKSR